MQSIVAALARVTVLPPFRKLERRIGCRVNFRVIPERFLNGMVVWNMTKTWKKFGLNIEAGANHWTIGAIANDVSTRFDPNAPEYQAWLGGYSVKLASDDAWTVREHFKLAIADQNSWLRTYGDPRPMTNINEWEFKELEPIRAGRYSGTLYEGGCTTHSDVGDGHHSSMFYLLTRGMAALFRLSNPRLRIKGGSLRPPASEHPYETIKLPGYIAIFDVAPRTKVVLYGNGTISTFDLIKDDLLRAMRSCEIT